MAIPLRLHDGDGASLRSERRRLEQAVAGRYRVLERISHGGMGSVWRAWEPGLERHVAIKLLAAGLCRDAESRGRFRREARILASLSHPSVVSVLAIGERQDACWYAMPFLPGGTLAERLGPARRLPDEEVRLLLLQLADALAYAHANGVVHRDIKAENVAFDPSGRPVITDFGVATLTTSDHSRSEITKGFGTTEYMAPEQFAGAPDADGRVDLYALGVLGFRMLTGRFPYEGNETQVAARRLTSDAAPVAAFAAGVSGDLAAAIDRCLARRPRDRWDSASELRDHLRKRRKFSFAGRARAAMFRLLRRAPKAAALLM